MMSLNPLENMGPAPLTVPSAYRAWSHWTNKLGVGCLQVPHVFRSFEGRTGDADRDHLLAALCEVYSRAIFEASIALEYDRVDSLVDIHVLHEVSDRWGPDMATLVHASVRAVGPVARDVATALSWPRPGDQTDQQ
jgi:hypothetical protein